MLPNDAHADDAQSQPSNLTLLAELGRGSYGAVHKALYKDKIAAVKALNIEPNEDGRHLAAELHDEIRLLRDCTSDYVVRYFGYLDKKTTLWIAMEYCDGGSVSDVLRNTRAPLSELEVAAVVSAIVRGLHYLHVEKRILHRDIKAGNVLLSASPRAAIKLCDLGVSASVQNHTKRSTVIGTPLWMSPELIASGAYGASTDIWSLGITALEMMEGAPPHANVNPTIRALFLITANPAPRLAAPEAWSAELREFVEKLCLVKEPEERASAPSLLHHPLVERGVDAGAEPILAMIERSRVAAASAAASRGVSSASDRTVGTMLMSQGSLSASELSAAAGRRTQDLCDTTSMSTLVSGYDDATTIAATLGNAIPSGRGHGAAPWADPPASGTLVRPWDVAPVEYDERTVYAHDTLRLSSTLSRDEVEPGAASPRAQQRGVDAEAYDSSAAAASGGAAADSSEEGDSSGRGGGTAGLGDAVTRGGLERIVQAASVELETMCASDSCRSEAGEESDALRELARLAGERELAPRLLADGASECLLRGLASSSTVELQAECLDGLLKLWVHAPDAQQALLSMSSLETLLGLGLAPTPEVRKGALELLTCLATNNPECAKELRKPPLFKTVLHIGRAQADEHDWAGTQRALRVVDVLVLEGWLSSNQLDQVNALAESLSAVDDEAMQEVARHTMHLLASAETNVGQRVRRGVMAVQDSLSNLFLSPDGQRTRSRRATPDNGSPVHARYEY